MSTEWVVPGHEIVGKVTHIGKDVTEFKVGQRVGVGAQVLSCLDCDRCNSDNENYCAQSVDTYNAPFRMSLYHLVIRKAMLISS